MNRGLRRRHPKAIDNGIRQQDNQDEGSVVDEKADGRNTILLVQNRADEGEKSPDRIEAPRDGHHDENVGGPSARFVSVLNPPLDEERGGDRPQREGNDPEIPGGSGSHDSIPET